MSFKKRKDEKLLAERKERLQSLLLEFNAIEQDLATKLEIKIRNSYFNSKVTNKEIYNEISGIFKQYHYDKMGQCQRILEIQECFNSIALIEGRLLVHNEK